MIYLYTKSKEGIKSMPKMVPTIIITSNTVQQNIEVINSIKDLSCYLYSSFFFIYLKKRCIYGKYIKIVIEKYVWINIFSFEHPFKCILNTMNLVNLSYIFIFISKNKCLDYELNWSKNIYSNICLWYRYTYSKNNMSMCLYFFPFERLPYFIWIS